MLTTDLSGRELQEVGEMYVMKRILTCCSLNIIVRNESRSIRWVRNVERVAYIKNMRINFFRTPADKSLCVTFRRR